MQYVPRSQRCRIRRSPFCSESIAVLGGFWGGFDLSSKAFPLRTAQLGLTRVSSRTWVGARGFLARSATPSCSLLLRDVTRMLLLQSRACLMLNTEPPPPQWRVRSVGSMPYQKNTASLHSWGERSVPFTVYAKMESHTPIFCLPSLV